MRKYPGVTWECATRIDFLRDEEMLEKRAIPTIANALTRKNLHFVLCIQ